VICARTIAHFIRLNSRTQNAEYAAANLGDDVIDTTNMCIEEVVERAF